MTKKYQAPQTDGGLFAVPSFQEYPQLILANRGVVGFQKDSLGFPLSDLRLRGRREILGESADLAKPVIMAGHQPELFHPGVWVKNFVLAGQAKKLQAHALNLIVDNDTFKHRSFHLPAISEHPELVELAKSEFDVSVPEVPYENAYPREFPTVETWFEQIQSATSRWPFEPMAKVVWPKIVHCLKNGASYSHAFVSVRQHYERQWGGGTPELPVSQLAETNSFAEFVHHLTLHARDFATEYNRAIVEFRRQNGIKSRNHPAPELAIDGPLTEVPFWVWNDDQPTRQRVFCRTVDDGVELLAGETPFVTLKTNDRPDEVRQRLKTSGWKLRPRALTLTMFSRLFLADLFIHGIGGGKYDEVTDAIIKRCFGITPPAYAVVSATIRLPLSRFPATPAKHLQQIRLLRDLAWNPQQFAEVQSSDPTLVAEKKALMTHEPSGHAERRQWYRQLSKITANLREKTADRRVHEADELTTINQQIEANRKILRRDFSWIFYPEETLSHAFRPFLD